MPNETDSTIWLAVNVITPPLPTKKASRLTTKGFWLKTWSRRESNSYLKFRKLLFYPLNYGTFFWCADFRCADVQIVKRHSKCKCANYRWVHQTHLSNQPFAHLHAIWQQNHYEDRPKVKQRLVFLHYPLPSVSCLAKECPLSHGVPGLPGCLPFCR